jgi:TolA-binding protein
LFDVRPENFCWTDHNIHVVNSTEENIKLEHLKAIVPELVGQGAIDPDVLVEISLSNSPTEIRRMVRANIAKKKEENDQAGQMQQQIEEASNQIQELQSQLEEAGKEIEALSKIDSDIKNREIAVKERQIENKAEIDRERLALDTKMEEREADAREKVVQLEREQLYLETNGNAKEITYNG